MDQVIHGVNNSRKNFLLSNYSLKTQIIIINILTALIGLFFIIFLNFYLLTSNTNLDNHRKIITSQLDEITNYLSNNAIKRILTFNDTCNSVSKESSRELARIEWGENSFLDKNYEDKTPQLDQTYTQQYIYSNFLNYSFNVKVFADNWIKFADTNDFYGGKEDIVVLDINSEIINDIDKNISFYTSYKNDYTFIKNAELPKEKQPACKPKKDCDICYLNTNGVPESINYNSKAKNTMVNMPKNVSIMGNDNVIYNVNVSQKNMKEMDNDYFKNNYEDLPDCPFDPCMSCDNNNKYKSVDNAFNDKLIEKYRVKK